jgi:hypothetical protein
MGFYYYQASSSSSPVVVLPAPQFPSQPYTMNSNNLTFTNPLPFGQASANPAAFSLPQTPLSAAGRKRSRDEAADNLQEDYSSPPVQESEEDWEYGEGMTLIKPNGFIIDASSQTGTWAEEKAENSQFQAQTPPAIQDRPTLRSHKSQRLDLTATPVIAEEISLSNGTVIASSPPKMVSNGMEEPTIDAFTIYLGIGWSRISDGEDIQAAARGWAKFIENHYPVKDVHIRLQSKGLVSYLVEAKEGWFLFGEDLKEGRLVSTSLERTFENLKTTPPVFDSEEILYAAGETPRVDIEAKHEIVMNARVETQQPVLEAIMNGILNSNSIAVQDVEMEMDIS